MLLTDEQKEGLTPEQIQVIEDAYTVKETELKGLAEKNAKGILDGFSKRLATITGMERDGTEKASVHFERIVDKWVPSLAESKVKDAENAIEEANRIAGEWEAKFKNHKGDETLKKELQAAQDEVAKIPQLLSAKDQEWKTKYDEVVTNHETSRINRSMEDAMPKFDDTLNVYEIKAKTKSATDRIKLNYKLSYDDNGNLIGTKDYNQYLVSDLLKGDEELKDLVSTDSNSGGGGGKVKKEKTTTLNLPEGISKNAGQQLIREYMSTVEGIKDKLDDKYSERFTALCKENNVL
jgi:hypothetical protein